MKIRSRNSAQCVVCKGVPSQHNIRDAKITVPSDSPHGPIINTYTQHGFVFASV